MKNKKVLVTCGPTREYLDPVRFISNRSTGTLGLELARALNDEGYKVTLVHSLGCERVKHIQAAQVRFESAKDLLTALKKEAPKHEALFMTAAVADFRPATKRASKTPKDKIEHITLRKNPDVLKSIRPLLKGFVMGFSVAGKNVEQQSLAKIKSKSLDAIISHSVGAGNDPFGEGSNKAFFAAGEEKGAWRNYKSKKDLARQIVRFYQKNSKA